MVSRHFHLQQGVLPVLGHVPVGVGLALLGLGVVNGGFAIGSLLLGEELLRLESCDTAGSCTVLASDPISCRVVVVARTCAGDRLSVFLVLNVAGGKDTLDVGV